MKDQHSISKVSPSLMMPEKRIGIVLQGPLISRGRTGSTAQVGFSKVTNEDVVDYNCIPLIKKMFDLYSKEYEIVCVIWDSEPDALKVELRRVVPEEAVVIIGDDTRYLPARGQVIPGNNKYRQIKSSLAGFEALSYRGCDYLAKVRSDQWVDIDLLVSDFMTHAEKKLLVPRLIKKSPDYLVDFYFMGEKELVLRLFKAYLVAPEIFESVHNDLFYVWGNVLIGKPFLPLKFRKFSLHQRYIGKVWNNFTPGSRSLYENLIWRGERLKSGRRGENIFSEDLRGQQVSDFIDGFSWGRAAKALISAIGRRLRRISRLTPEASS